jgi:hypothetical protein
MGLLIRLVPAPIAVQVKEARNANYDAKGEQLAANCARKRDAPCCEAHYLKYK